MPRQVKHDCQNSPLEKGLFVSDIRELAKYSIRTFFEDKSWYCGGSVPENLLLSDESIKTVLRTPNTDEVFVFIHQCLAKTPEPFGYKRSLMEWTVHLLLGHLTDMKQKWLPKSFQPGLLFLYFKFCKGLQIPPPPMLS